jgi:hypothetical protein
MYKHFMDTKFLYGGSKLSNNTEYDLEHVPLQLLSVNTGAKQRTTNMIMNVLHLYSSLIEAILLCM